MDKWDELHKKECLLLEQEDVLIREKNQVQRVKVSAGAKVCVKWNIMGNRGKVCVSYSK